MCGSQPTGWEHVDRAIAKARSELELAAAEEDFQAIGLLWREATLAMPETIAVDAMGRRAIGVPACPYYSKG